MKKANILAYFFLLLILFFLLYLSIRTSQGVDLLEKRITTLEQKVISLSLQKPEMKELEEPPFKKEELKDLLKDLREETKALFIKIGNSLLAIDKDLKHLKKENAIIQEAIISLQMDTEETIGKIDKIMEFLGIGEKVPKPPEPEIEKPFKKEIEKPKPVMEKKKWKELQPLQPKRE